MKNRTRTADSCSLLALLISTFLASIFFCTTAYAGNINGNEQSIVSVIHGQFEQDGIVYKVRQEYINSAMSYLQQDDVDLTAEQAQSVISEIYSNVQTGVDSGYLEPIGQTAPQETPPADGASAGDAGAAGAEKGGNAGDGSGDGANDGAAAGAVSGENPDGADGASENETPDDTGQTQENGTASGEAIPEEMPEPPKIISILELVDKAPPQSYEYLARDTNALMERIYIPYQTVFYIIIIMAAVIAVIAVISFVKKLLVHHHHRKLRKCLKYILAAEIGVLFAICFMIAGIWIGAFQDSAVLNKLADTGYYRTIFEELRRDTSISFALLDIPDHVMDDAITYERVVLAARQQVESDLSQGAYQADTSVLTEKLETDIKSYLEGESVTMTEQAQIGLNELMNRLDQKYSSLLQWPFVAWWVEMRAEFLSFVKIALPFSLLLIFGAQALIIFLNHYKHRGVALCGRSILAGGVITIAAFCAGLSVIAGKLPKVTPDYMEVFFNVYGNGLCKAGIIAGAIGVLLGVICLVGVHNWKDAKR